MVRIKYTRDVPIQYMDLTPTAKENYDKISTNEIPLLEEYLREQKHEWRETEINYELAFSYKDIRKFIDTYGTMKGVIIYG